MEVPQKDPFLIRFYGRVGTGVGACGKALAEACLQEDFHVQAFADYPLKFLSEPAVFSVLFSRKPLFWHRSVLLPDIAILLDETLKDEADFRLNLAPDGWALINTRKNAKEAAKNLPLATKVFSFNASETAEYFLGKDLPNLALLGAFLRVCPFLQRKTLEEAVQNNFADGWGKELTEKNIIAIRMGYNEMDATNSLHE